MEKNFLPFAKPYIGKEEIDEVVDSLRSGWVTMGPKTAKFEKLLEKYTGAKAAVAVNSCTAAMHLSLLALGIGKGDEVITTPYTFAATVNVIVQVGAKPVFVDVQRDSANIDPDRIRKAITKRTKAIMPVHYGGQPCDMDEIRKIAKEHNLDVIEDAAHAIGAEYGGKPVGTSSRAVCFSFYATKNITTGEGGAVTTGDEKLANRLRELRLHGMSAGAWKRYTKKGSWYYEIVDCGWKDNMTDLQAALGIHQMKRLARLRDIRREYAKIYTREFKDLDVITPIEKPGRLHAFHLYPLLLRNYDRAEFIERMKDKDIGCGVHFIPVHMHPYYRKLLGYKKGSFPNAEWFYEHEVSLPIYPRMSKDDVSRVVEAVKKIINK
ncbi:MAG: DegT/DnrJ/EryC1/StrS family aminotransferase [Candidatus Micrarchaeaceae archaeon]